MKVLQGKMKKKTKKNSEEDFLDEEDIDDEEMLIGKLLSRYINDKMDREAEPNEEEK